MMDYMEILQKPLFSEVFFQNYLVIRDLKTRFDGFPEVFGGYGNRGCGVFKGGVQNQKGFCIRINMPKGNY